MKDVAELAALGSRAITSSNNVEVFNANRALVLTLVSRHERHFGKDAHTKYRVPIACYLLLNAVQM